MAVSKIRIERTVKLVCVVEVNADTYPDMTAREAVDSEYAEELGDKLQVFAEDLSVVDFGKPIDWNTPGVTGDFSERILVVNEFD